MSGAPVESRRRLERGAQAVLGCGLERGCSPRREWGNNPGKGRGKALRRAAAATGWSRPRTAAPGPALPGPIPSPFTAESPARNPERKAALVQAQHLFSAAIFLTPFCLSLSFFLCWCRCSFPQDFWGRAIPDAAFRIQTGLVGCSSFEGFALSQGVLRRDRNRLFKAVCFELSWHIQARLFLCFLKKKNYI